MTSLGIIVLSSCFISMMYVGYLCDTIVVSSLLHFIYVYGLPLVTPNVTITKSSHKPLKDSSNKRKTNLTIHVVMGIIIFLAFQLLIVETLIYKHTINFGFHLSSGSIIILRFSCSFQSKSKHYKTGVCLCLPK